MELVYINNQGTCELEMGRNSFLHDTIENLRKYNLDNVKISDRRIEIIPYDKDDNNTVYLSSLEITKLYNVIDTKRLIRLKITANYKGDIEKKVIKGQMLGLDIRMVQLKNNIYAVIDAEENVDILNINIISPLKISAGRISKGENAGTVFRGLKLMELDIRELEDYRFRLIKGCNIHTLLVRDKIDMNYLVQSSSVEIIRRD